MMPRDKTARLDDDDDENDDDSRTPLSSPAIARGFDFILQFSAHRVHMERRDAGMFDALAVGSRVHGSQGM